MSLNLLHPQIYLLRFQTRQTLAEYYYTTTTTTIYYYYYYYATTWNTYLYFKAIIT